MVLFFSSVGGSFGVASSWKYMYVDWVIVVFQIYVRSTLIRLVEGDEDDDGCVVLSSFSMPLCPHATIFVNSEE